MLMRRYWVVTPQFSYTEHVCAEGGPTYDTCDAIEIEAETKRDALLLGVKAMSEDHRYYSYCREQREAGLSPYEGVYVEPSDPQDALNEALA